MKKTMLILLFIVVLSINIVSAGFASTYLPENKETGMDELRLELGEIGVVHIYPSNPENNSIYCIIEVTEGKEYLVEELEENYEVPPLSKSDDYDIKMAFKLPRNATEGQKFRISYKITSTTSITKEEGMVEISPAGFIKRFDMVMLLTEKEPINKMYYYIGLGAIVAIIGTITLVLLRRNKRKRSYY